MKTNCREQRGTGAAVEVDICGFAKHASLGLIVLMMVVLAIGPLQAKVDAGISGIVTDASGAVVQVQQCK